MRQNLVGNKIADHSDVAGASRCSNYIYILHLTPGFNWLVKDNCKTRQKTFKFWDLERVVLDVWR